MNKKEQIEKMTKDLIEIFDEEYEKRRLITPQNTANKMSEKGYRKQSEWEWIKEGDFFVCSNCGSVKPFVVINNKTKYYRCDYCIRCGAKMRKEDEGK